MDNAQREIRHEIESTRAGMVEKITTLEERIECAIQEVKRSVDPKYQTQQRPWLMTGLSVAAGYLLGRIVFGGSPPKARVVLPDNWPERGGSHYRNGSLAQNLSGMISGIVTVVGVSLAREFATSMLSKRHGRDHGDGANGPGTEFNERRFQ
ncbi:MAG TPA: hypothetical protein VGB09_03400 [Candidatus Binatia bacterium]|jgi:tetrahydromethanopterin S-methyltransferase subunit B